MKTFIFENYIYTEDAEVCPFIYNDPRTIEWHREDDKRILLLALERYADDIIPRKPGVNVGRFADILAIELERITPRLKEVFEQDSPFYSKLKRR